MKAIIALLLATTAAATLVAAPLQVHLQADSETPVIGELATESLAVAADWPEGVEPVAGWRPVYYQGVFEVYVDNNDISKNLTAKPGSPYYLSPVRDAETLSVATEKDKVDIVSVDNWFCKMQLETIVLGYIKEASVAASSIVTSLPSAPSESMQSGTAAAALTELVGRLEKTGLIGKKRTGTSYKLTAENGQTLAFLKTSEIPERVQIGDLLNLKVRVTGFLTQGEVETDVILKATTIIKTN